MKIRQRRASRARTEEQANIVRAFCRVPGRESVPAPGIRGNKCLVQPFLDRTAASSQLCRQPKSKRCLRALLEPSAKWGLERTRSHNQIIRFCTMKVARGDQFQNLPPTCHLTLSASNLTHSCEQMKDRTGFTLPGRWSDHFILLRPIPGRRWKHGHPGQDSRRSKCIPGACDGY